MVSKREVQGLVAAFSRGRRVVRDMEIERVKAGLKEGVERLRRDAAAAIQLAKVECEGDIEQHRRDLAQASEGKRAKSRATASKSGRSKAPRASRAKGGAGVKSRAGSGSAPVARSEVQRLSPVNAAKIPGFGSDRSVLLSPVGHLVVEAYRVAKGKQRLRSVYLPKLMAEARMLPGFRELGGVRAVKEWLVAHLGSEGGVSPTRGEPTAVSEGERELWLDFGDGLHGYVEIDLDKYA